MQGNVLQQQEEQHSLVVVSSFGSVAVQHTHTHSRRRRCQPKPKKKNLGPNKGKLFKRSRASSGRPKFGVCNQNDTRRNYFSPLHTQPNPVGAPLSTASKERHLKKWTFLIKFPDQQTRPGSVKKSQLLSQSVPKYLARGQTSRRRKFKFTHFGKGAPLFVGHVHIWSITGCSTFYRRKGGNCTASLLYL